MKKRKIKYIIFMLAFSLLFIFSAKKLHEGYAEYERGEREYGWILEKAVNEKDGYLDIDFDALLKENPDTVGWIYMPGTKISYPVVQGRDNEFYLHRDFHKNWSNYGTIFIDAGIDMESAKVLTLYGHNMRNGSMFGSLKRFLDGKYRKKHESIHFYMPDKVRVYETFAAYITDVHDRAYRLPYESEDEARVYVGEVLERHKAKRASVTEQMETITLSTCHGRSGSDVRLLVQGIKVEEKDYPIK